MAGSKHTVLQVANGTRDAAGLHDGRIPPLMIGNRCILAKCHPGPDAIIRNRGTADYEKTLAAIMD